MVGPPLASRPARRRSRARAAGAVGQASVCWQRSGWWTGAATVGRSSPRAGQSRRKLASKRGAISGFEICIRYIYNWSVQFQFDPAKAAANLQKHGVSFADAEGVFADPLAMHRSDPDAEGHRLGQRRRIVSCRVHLARRRRQIDLRSAGDET